MLSPMTFTAGGYKVGPPPQLPVDINQWGSSVLVTMPLLLSLSVVDARRRHGFDLNSWWFSAMVSDVEN
jgi:hypothetical protein